jgi:hypothetical protein
MMGAVVERPDLSVEAAKIAIQYELPIRDADAIVAAIARKAMGLSIVNVVLPDTPERGALLAAYRLPDGSIKTER